jgi:outer membrane protein TolC
VDARDALVRLMADPRMNMLGESEIVPTSEPHMAIRGFDRSEVLELAMTKNPAIQQAKIAIEIADINIDVTQNQRMPRLDLVASARMQGLAEESAPAHGQIGSGDYTSYAVGLMLEYPLGNRQREAELLRRRLERRKAISTLQNIADKVATQVKEKIRQAETIHAEIGVQKEAAEAARIHLQALEDSEPIRERLTPEFLLVKLQAQEALARAERAEIEAVVGFNISLAQLAQATGTVLELNQVRTSLPVAAGGNEAVGPTSESTTR